MVRLSLKGLPSALAALAIAAGLGVSASAFAAGTPQASITLTNCGSALCNANNTDWSLAKTPALQTLTGDNTIAWNVAATQGATTDNFITVNGTITVTNTGTANATIGNIVVNLQKPRTGPNTGACRNIPWVSAAADVADATQGDASTQDNIVAAASTEVAACNALQGAHNYTVSGAQGTFSETPGVSGALQFTDASDNTVFSLVPEPVLAPGASITLLYTAQFDNTALGLAAGTSLRAEAIVTFGNAGARGGSGSSATNIDINGDGRSCSTEIDECNVRSVPCRVTTALPTLTAGNSSVTLTDTSADVTVIPTGNGVDLVSGSFSTTIGGGSGTETITAAATPVVTSDSVSTGETCSPPGAATVNNTANLFGASSSVTVQGPQIGTDPVTGLPIFAQFTFACVTGVDIDASANAAVSCEETLPPPPVSACTVTQGGYGGTAHGNNPDSVLEANFSTVYPSGVEVGIPGASGFSMKFSSASAVEAYLPAGGTAGALTGDLVSPTSSSSGVFGGQVLTLQISVDFEAKGFFVPAGGTPIGSLYLVGTGTSLDGQTVAQILAAANTALGGGALPAGYTLADLNTLVDNLNNAFDVPGCAASTWALLHLSSTAPIAP